MHNNKFKNGIGHYRSDAGMYPRKTCSKILFNINLMIFFFFLSYCEFFSIFKKNLQHAVIQLNFKLFHENLPTTPIRRKIHLYTVKCWWFINSNMFLPALSDKLLINQRISVFFSRIWTEKKYNFSVPRNWTGTLKEVLQKWVMLLDSDTRDKIVELSDIFLEKM